MEINRFDVYLVNLDPTVGHEIKKTRPCLIISPNEMNNYISTVIIAPMTSKGRTYPSRISGSFQGNNGQIVLDQIRTIDKRRLDSITNALQKESTTEFSYNLVPTPSQNISSAIDASTSSQIHEERRTKITRVSRRRLGAGEDSKTIRLPEQPEGSISTRVETTPEVQKLNSSIPQQMDQYFGLKAATSKLNTKNSYLAAVKKDQENNLRHNDKLQIQNIQNGLLFRQLIPLQDNISVNVEPPLDAFSPLWAALIKSISRFLNVPEATLISGLLAAIYTAVCGKLVVKRNHHNCC